MSTDEDISELTDSDERDIAEQASESENAGSDSEAEGMYGNEPEYMAAELLLLSDEANISTDSEGGRGGDLNSSRLENMHWCTCAECSIMPTLPESKCCQEFKVLLEGKLSDEVTCITKHAKTTSQHSG